MPVPLSVHWIPAHRGSIGGKTDAEWFRLWDPAYVKMVVDDERPPYLEDVPVTAKIIIRNYPMSELGHDRGFAVRGMEAGAVTEVTQNGSGKDDLVRGRGAFAAFAPINIAIRGVNTNPEEISKQHAAACHRMAQYCESKGIQAQRLLFEGLNEPMLWSTEPPTQVARYYRQFLLSLQDYGLRGVAGNFGVGWPGNGGIQNAPVDWSFWKDVAKIIADSVKFNSSYHHYQGLHEYWGLNGAGQNWRWWGGRYEQCPFDIPILITETGIDTGVTGQWYGGWGDLPGTWDEKARRYVGELAWYWKRCLTDGRIKGILPFTYDIGSSHWEKFNLRDEVFLKELIARKAEFPSATDQPVTKPVDPVIPVTDAVKIIREAAWHAAGLPYNPEAALARYAREQGMGNPVTPEFDIVNGAKYRAQGFAGGIVYAKIGDWGNCQIVKW